MNSMEKDLFKLLAEKYNKSVEEFANDMKPYMETQGLNYRLKEAADIINNILVENGVPGVIEPEDIEFDAHYLVNRHYTTEDNLTSNVDSEGHEVFKSVTMHRRSKLSKIIFDAYYPTPQGTTFYHYTSLSGLRGILKRELKISSLMKNYNDDEFRSFYKDHDITGYEVNVDDDGVLMQESIMRQTYAMCFAIPDGLTEAQEDALWRSFADNGQGVKIHFKIETKHPDFRKIFYRHKHVEKKDLLFNKLNNAIQNKFNRQFTVSGISKIGAFYLPGTYNIENEARFLIKKYTDQYDFNVEEYKNHIILPFESQYASISIDGISPGKHCAMTQLNDIIATSEWSRSRVGGPTRIIK
jgi:hypothetical protein